MADRTRLDLRGLRALVTSLRGVAAAGVDLYANHFQCGHHPSVCFGVPARAWEFILSVDGGPPTARRGEDARGHAVAALRPSGPAAAERRRIWRRSRLPS